MTAVVIDASAGVEIVADTRRGRALGRLLSADSQGWVPEHFYAEVLGVLRRQFLIERTISEAQATAAVGRLGLAEEIGGDLLTDDYKLAATPNFPAGINVFQLPVRS